jgi:hypothetical protein
MQPNQVEPTARSMMGALKRFWNRINGTLTSGGSAGAYTLTPANVAYPTAYVQGETYTFRANSTSVGSDTLNVNGLGAKPLYKPTTSGPAVTAAGDIQSGQIVQAVYDGNLGGSGAFQCISGITAGATSVTDIAHGGTNSSGPFTSNALVVGGTSLATNADWKITSNVLTGNLNAAAPPAGVTALVAQFTQVDSTIARVEVDAFGQVPAIAFTRANNTNASPTQVVNGNVLGQIEGWGYTSGAAYGSAYRGSVGVQALESWTTPNQGAGVFITATRTGTTIRSTAATFQAAQDGGCQMVGTAAGDSAAAGNIGEYQESIVLIGSEISLSSGVAADVTSIGLSPGDWSVWGEAWFDCSGSPTISGAFQAGINTTSATLVSVPTSGASRIKEYYPSPSAQQVGVVMDVPPCRVSSGSLVTVFLSVIGTFSAGSMSAYGKICARRIR